MIRTLIDMFTGLILSAVLTTGFVLVYFALPLASAFWLIKFVGQMVP